MKYSLLFLLCSLAHADQRQQAVAAAKDAFIKQSGLDVLVSNTTKPYEQLILKQFTSDEKKYVGAIYFIEKAITERQIVVKFSF